ncbi:MAG: putative rane protein [Thermoleophilaceae bacterium]|nr:putative rane protein [Thermoleophilaceae bacterium]
MAPPPERELDEPPKQRFDADGDATRRTLLASERTLLAWLRTGLTVTAVALAVGKIAPDLAGKGGSWQYATLGGAYALLGVAVVIYGLRRGREVDRALRDGRWVSLDDRVMWALGLVTIGLGVATTVLIVAGV